MKLNEEFYQGANVVEIARNLLGKALFTRKKKILTGGIIVETEAYSWREKGCHAYNAKKTERNAIMFEAGGHSYVYLCYGIHYLFNVVTNVPGTADAVLIRALQPLEGLEEMKKRRGALASPYHLTSGPGKLSKALGIDRTFNGKSLLNDEVWIEDLGNKIAKTDIEASPRIGIDYAGVDALLPWRFTLKKNPWVSR
ncbi:MAG TPA: DNA-3-methyladenine glycosylase, partial [Chryseosolibacter sp.]